MPMLMFLLTHQLIETLRLRYHVHQQQQLAMYESGLPFILYINSPKQTEHNNKNKNTLPKRRKKNDWIAFVLMSLVFNIVGHMFIRSGGTIPSYTLKRNLLTCVDVNFIYISKRSSKAVCNCNPIILFINRKWWGRSRGENLQ